MSTQEENPAVLLRQLIEARLEQVHTWLPAKLIDFDPTTLRATVQATLLKVMGPPGNQTKLEYPTIFEADVLTIKTNTFGMRAPYEEDDPIAIGFYERSTEEILRDVQQRDPTFSRKHHLTDALVVRGRMTDKEGTAKPFPDCWLDEWIFFHRDKPGTCIRILPDGAVVVQVDDSAKCYIGSGTEGCEPGDVAVDYAILGTRHRAWAADHVHSGVMPGGGVTGPPTEPPPATSGHVLIGE